MTYYHYRNRDKFMEHSEVALFHSLQQLIGDRYYIFAQIHLGSLVGPRLVWNNYRMHYEWLKAYFFADKYSVDYVVCDRFHLEPLLAIELDGTSHRLYWRHRRDLIVNQMFHEANLPLLRISRDEALDQPTVARLLGQTISF